SNDTTNITSCPSPYRPKQGNFRRQDLIASVNETAGVGVDVLMLQPGLGWVPWWKSTVLPMADHIAWSEGVGRKPITFEKCGLGGGDMVEIFVKGSRARGIVRFISLRVNDTHKVSRGMRHPDPTKRRGAMSEFQMYADHPEWLLG